jgi:excisionase family DNA binding protein
MPEQEELLTVIELAARLKVSVTWVYIKTRDKGENSIPRIKVGRHIRFRLTEVMTWLQKNKPTIAYNKKQIKTIKMSDTQELIILQHKIRAIRDNVTRSLDALFDEIEAKLPEEKFRPSRPDPSERLRKLAEEKRKNARPCETITRGSNLECISHESAASSLTGGNS